MLAYFLKAVIAGMIAVDPSAECTEPSASALCEDGTGTAFLSRGPSGVCTSVASD